jgi:hypothetical protein
MFIIFDSSNQLLDQLIKTNIQYVGRRSITALPMSLEKRFNVPTDDRYPTYGMDIPNSCKIIRNNLFIEIDL